MENQNEDIMKQEREYKPSNYADEFEDDDDDDDDTNEEVTAESLTKKQGMNKIVLFGIAGVVGIILIIIAISSSAKKKQAEADAAHADELLEPYSEEVFSYTPEEVEALRENGYTGYEIDDFEFDEVDAASLIQAAEEKRKAKYEAELVPYLDSASEEFKSLKSKTWLCLDEFEIGEDPSQWEYHTENFNVDYEKITASGMQCFIKFYLADGGIGFLAIKPDRYAEIDPSGNMVLKINYVVMENGNRVIIDAQEVEV